MAKWSLIVTTVDGDEYEFFAGEDEVSAVKALKEAEPLVGMRGTVTVANRLALRGDRIAAIWIDETDDE